MRSIFSCSCGAARPSACSGRTTPRCCRSGNSRNISPARPCIATCVSSTNTRSARPCSSCRRASACTFRPPPPIGGRTARGGVGLDEHSVQDARVSAARQRVPDERRAAPARRGAASLGPLADARSTEGLCLSRIAPRSLPAEAPDRRGRCGLEPRAAKRMKICLLGLDNLPVLAPEHREHTVGGESVQQTLLARALVRRGHEVSMVTADYGQADAAVWEDIRVYKAYRPEAGLPLVSAMPPCC